MNKSSVNAHIAITLLKLAVNNNYRLQILNCYGGVDKYHARASEFDEVVYHGLELAKEGPEGTYGISGYCKLGDASNVYETYNGRIWDSLEPDVVISHTGADTVVNTMNAMDFVRMHRDLILNLALVTPTIALVKGTAAELELDKEKVDALLAQVK